MSDAETAHAAILARLRTMANVDVMDGAVGEAGQPGPRVDPTGGVHMYAVLHTGGAGRVSDSLCPTPHRQNMTVHVICVGGDPDAARRCVDKVQDVLTGWRPLPSSGELVEFMDAPPPPAREATPPPAVWTVPLIFTVQLT